MRVLDLFSGIGGMSLGLERAGMTTVAFCEIEPFPRRVLAKHWPEVPCYHDVRTLTAAVLSADGIGPIDVITAGFPCQDISVAGRGAGVEGERSGLWAEVVRLVRELQPRFVLLENSPSLCTRGGSAILAALADERYDAEWEGIPALSVGAKHIRARQFIVAYPSQERHGAPPCEVFARRDGAFDGYRWPSEPRVGRVADGVPDGVDRRAALGNAVVPQVVEWIGHRMLEAAA